MILLVLPKRSLRNPSKDCNIVPVGYNIHTVCEKNNRIFTQGGQVIVL